MLRLAFLGSFVIWIQKDVWNSKRKEKSLIEIDCAENKQHTTEHCFGSLKLYCKLFSGII